MRLFFMRLAVQTMIVQPKDRAIHYYERAKERMEDVNAGDRRQTQMSFIKTEIGMNPVCIQRIVTWKKQYLCIDGYLQTAAVTKSQRSI